MGDINTLLELDFSSIIVGVFVCLFAFKSVITIVEWFCVKLGIETKWNRQKREERELLVNTSNAVKELKETHEKDKKEVNNKNHELENVLTIFMDEMRETYEKTQKDIKQFNEKQIEYRGISIERERRLNERINEMAVLDESRDSIISEIGTKLNRLTDLFVNKEIEDLRWTILDFTASLSDGKKYNREAFDQVMRLYHRYEKILDEHEMENGLVEESVKFIQEKYHEKLKNGFK